VNGCSDIKEEDYKSPVDEKPITANVNLTEQVKPEAQPVLNTQAINNQVVPEVPKGEKKPEDLKAEDLN
jgi:hypothetical protein